jgi:hypothetical protein
MRLFSLITLLLASSLGAAGLEDPQIGQPAPALDQAHPLSNYKGKILVLEWVNKGCPFVKKHYGSGNMQALQKKYKEKGVAWVGVVSSAKGKEGYFKNAAQAAAWQKEQGALQDALILDPDGEIGQRYGAKATPHMFVIDAQGKLAYKGAIDDKPSADPGDIKSAKNYVAQALDALLAGKRPAVPETKAYGCSVKYADAPKPRSFHEHETGFWICDTWYDDAKGGHRCSFKSGKPGICGWCGAKLVKAGSKEDLARLKVGK